MKIITLESSLTHYLEYLYEGAYVHTCLQNNALGNATVHRSA